MTDALSDAEFEAAIAPWTEHLKAQGFEFKTVDNQPCWFRSEPFTEEQVAAGFIPRQAKLVIWRHPRRMSELQAHVAASGTPHKVHLRFFDPDWAPETVQPGYIGKGFAFAGADDLRGLARRIVDVLWPRVEAWFEEPVEAMELLRGRA